MIGVDVLNMGIGFLSERKIYQGFISSEIKKRTHAIADFGWEQNFYKKNYYDASANGIFAKIGTFYMLVQDTNDNFNGFFAGAKLGASFFNQEYKAVPVLGYQGNNSSVAFPPSHQSAYWIETILGGRVNLFNSNFYIDVNVLPKYLFLNTTQEHIHPMVIPGFGHSSSKINFGFSWNLAYRF